MSILQTYVNSGCSSSAERKGLEVKVIPKADIHRDTNTYLLGEMPLITQWESVEPHS